MNPSDDYKLTDLDYLIGDHHLQMIKASLPYLGVPEQKAISLFVKVQELRKTVELFETEEVASMGICSLERPQGNGSMRDLLKAIRPYGNPMEQDMIDMAAQNLGACAYHHIVAQGGMAFTLLGSHAAQGNPLVNGAVIAHHCGLSDNHSASMVNQDAPAQPGAGMNLDKGEKTGNL